MNFEMEVELSEKGLITINLQNHGEAFEGVLLIEENVSSVYGNTQEQILELLFPQGVNENAGTMQSRNILYQKKVKLSADETKKEQFFLALPDNTSQGSLAVKCQDGNGKNIKGTTLEIPYSGTMANKAAYALTEEIPWRLLSDIPVKPQPSLWSFSLLLALYALLAGPMLYLFLKKIKQRYFLFPGITLLSFLFVLFVLGMGGKTRLVAPYITYYGKYVQREEALDYSVKFGIQAPYNESYSLYVDHSYTLVPGMQKEDFLNPVTLGIRKSSNKIKIEDMDEHYRLTMSEMPAFTPNYFQAQKQYPLEEKKRLHANVVCKKGKVSGTIWNNTDFSFEDVILVVEKGFVHIGKLPAGKKAVLNLEGVYFWGSGSLPGLLEKCLKTENAGEQIKEIYKNIIYENADSYQSDGYILGIVKAGKLDLQMESGYETYGRSIYLAPVNASAYLD